jgi:hypothetical protein
VEAACRSLKAVYGTFLTLSGKAFRYPCSASEAETSQSVCGGSRFR